MPGADKVLILEKVNEKVEGVPYIFFGKFKGLSEFKREEIDRFN